MSTSYSLEQLGLGNPSLFKDATVETGGPSSIPTYQSARIQLEQTEAAKNVAAPSSKPETFANGQGIPTEVIDDDFFLVNEPDTGTDVLGDWLGSTAPTEKPKTLSVKYAQTINKVSKSLRKTVGKLFSQTFPGIDPYTGLATDAEPTDTKVIVASDIKKEIGNNMKLYGKMGLVGGLMGGMVAGDGMTPDAWIGSIPIEIVTYYDFAESDSVVKYRAFGGEYFAHQGGDKNAMRVDFLLVGDGRDVMMNALRLLRFYSKSQQAGAPLFNTDESYITDPINARGEGLWTAQKVKRRRATALKLDVKGMARLSYDELQQLNIDLSTDFNGTPTGITSALWNQLSYSNRESMLDTNDPTSPVYKSPLTPKELSKTGWATDTTQSDEYYGMVPSKNVDINSVQRTIFQDQKLDAKTGETMVHGDKFYELQNQGYYTYHYNYPVIIKNQIFNNMWIETVQFTQEAKQGIDVIVGHLLLRKYMRPPKLRWSAGGKIVAAQEFKTTKDSQSRTLQERQEIAPGNTYSASEGAKYEQKLGMYPTDKKVWVWEEKRDDKPQITEIVSNLLVGVVNTAVKNLFKIIQNKGVMKLSFLSFQPDSYTSIASRVVL